MERSQERSSDYALARVVLDMNKVTALLTALIIKPEIFLTKTFRETAWRVESNFIYVLSRVCTELKSLDWLS